MTNKQEPEIRTLADAIDAENKLARECEILKTNPNGFRPTNE